jgi:hypothetical protein
MHLQNVSTWVINSTSARVIRDLRFLQQCTNVSEPHGTTIQTTTVGWPNSGLIFRLLQKPEEKSEYCKDIPKIHLQLDWLQKHILWQIINCPTINQLNNQLHSTESSVKTWQALSYRRTARVSERLTTNCVNKSPPLDSILSQPNPVRYFRPRFPKTHFVSSLNPHLGPTIGPNF